MKIKKLLVVIIAVTMLLTVAAACSGEVKVEGVALNKTTLSLVVGGSETLNATVSPNDAANKNVTWSSSNEGVATVTESGLVAAKSIGTATITVKTDDGEKKAACAVTVTEESTDPLYDEKVHVFEAECSIIDAVQRNEVDGDQCRAGNEGKTTSKNPSGGAYVYNMSKATSVSCTFEIYSDAAVTAALVMRMGHRSPEYYFQNLFTFTLNGTERAPAETVAFVEYDSATEKQYYAWRDTKIMDISLVAGKNTLKFTKKSGGLNFDCIKLVTDYANLQWYGEYEAGGHEYGDWQADNNPKVLRAWEVSENPTFEKEGKVAFYCKHCRHSREAVIPVIGSGGYTEQVITAAGAEVFGKATWTYHHEEYDTNIAFDVKSDPTNGTVKDKKFEAEQMTIGTPAMVKEESGSNDPSNGAYVGNISGNAGASVTLDITSDKKTQALLTLCYGARNDRDSVFNETFTLKVNGKAVTVDSSVILYGANSTFNYFNWTEFEISVIDLIEGRNTVEIALIGKTTASNIDYLTLRSSANLQKYVEL